MPTINERYRGKNYCYWYGSSIVGSSTASIAKIDVCTGNKSQIFLRTLENINFLFLMFSNVLYK